MTFNQLVFEAMPSDESDAYPTSTAIDAWFADTICIVYDGASHLFRGFSDAILQKIARNFVDSVGIKN